MLSSNCSKLISFKVDFHFIHVTEPFLKRGKLLVIPLQSVYLVITLDEAVGPKQEATGKAKGV